MQVENCLLLCPLHLVYTKTVISLQPAGSQRCKIVVRLLHTDFHALTPYYVC
jgi:hypothetical protein